MRGQHVGERLAQWALAALPLVVLAVTRLTRSRQPSRVIRMARPRPPGRPPPRRTPPNDSGPVVRQAAATPPPPPRVRVTDLQEVSWRKWRKVLGAVYWGWAIFQVLAAIWLSAEGVANPLLYWGTTIVVFALYLWSGARLMQDRYDGRVLPGGLAALALIEVPIGTAVGLFGLWVILRRRHARVRVEPVSDVTLEHA